MKHDYLDIYLIMSFRAGKSANTSAMRVIVFGKRLKFKIDIKNAKKKKKI